MPTQIAVIGSSARRIPARIREEAFTAGSLIAQHGCVMVTGGATGVSFYAAKGAKKCGGTVVAVNPLSEKVWNFQTLDFRYADVTINSGFGLKGRNVIAINSADGVLAISGSYGTLNEVTIALDLGKPLAVVRKTGGVAGMLHGLIRELGCRGPVQLFDDPGTAVRWLLERAAPGGSRYRSKVLISGRLKRSPQKSRTAK
jgi:hypothetical protein